jgi:molecular chaperone DnaK
VAQKATAALYEQGQAASAEGGAPGSAKVDDDVVDAEIIDDEGKKQ